MRGIYKFADAAAEICSLYDEVQLLCKDYKCDEKPEFTVKITQSHIERERERSAAEDRKEGRAVRDFPDSYLETLAVYREITEQMCGRDVLLFHGSAVAVDGEGYLFTAKSGTGKSTHTRLWREYFGERAVMINDDKPLIRVTDNEVRVFGTPWDGKHRISNNISAPLRAICILERAEENRIAKISAAQALPMLLQQVCRVQSPAGMKKLLTLIDRLSGSVSLYRLGCNTDISAAQVAFDGMKG